MDSIDPRITILEFLKNLPETIRTEELLFVLLYGTGKASLEESDRRLSQAAEKLDQAEVSLKYLISQKPDFTQAGLLALPLRKKHYALALERWKNLKQGVLAEHNLRRFEGNPPN